MSKTGYEYFVTSKIEHKSIPRKIRLMLSEIKIGDRISVQYLFEKNKSHLTDKDENYHKKMISKSLKIAHDSKMIERSYDSSMPEWFQKLDTVSFWQSQLRGNKLKNSKGVNSTKSQYLYHLWQFNKWLIDKSFLIHTLQVNTENSFTQKTHEVKFKNIEDMITLLEQPFADQKNITKIIKKYLLDDLHIQKKASYMIVIKSAIASYFEKNEYPLQITFNPKTSHDAQIEEQSMSLSDFMEFLTTGKPSISEKTMFLCKFHRGLDVSTLVDRFNYHAWGQITQWFKSKDHNFWDLEKCPVPISLIRVKTDYKHVGFLERDAITMLQKYLDFRKTKTGEEMQDGQALFLNKFDKPISTGLVFDSFARIAKRAGIQKFVEINGRKQFKMDSHELRDLLKSTLIDSGCRIDVADHVIGHRPKDSYEKQTTLYPETLRKEYAKASKMLNIFTRFTSIVNSIDDTDDLNAELNEKMKKIIEIEKRLESELIYRKRDEMFNKTAFDMMSKMQKQIDELTEDKERNNISKISSNSVEFCCVDCSIIHSKDQCPNCNSMKRRMYEER